MKRLKETGVLIPTYNAMSYDTFPELIKLLSSAKNDLGKILIIDSSSNDKTVEFITNSGIEVLVIPTQQFEHGATRDMGVKILSDKYYFKLSAISSAKYVTIALAPALFNDMRLS